MVWDSICGGRALKIVVGIAAVVLVMGEGQGRFPMMALSDYQVLVN
jgi:hypothetical protein